MAVAMLQTVLVSLVLLTQCAVRCQNEFRVEWTVSGVVQYANSPLQVPLGYTVIFLCQNNSFSNVIYQADLQQQDSCNSTVTGGERIKVGECNGSPSSIRQEVTQNSQMLMGTVHYEPGRTYYFTSYSDGTFSGSLTRVTSGGECLQGLKLAFEVTNVTQTPDNNNGGNSVVITGTPSPVPTSAPPTGAGVQDPPLTTVHIAIIGAAGGVVVVIIVVVLFAAVCCICAGKDRSRKVAITEESCDVEMGKGAIVVTTLTSEVGNGVGDKRPLSTQSKNRQKKPSTQLAPVKNSKPPMVESNQGVKLDPIRKPHSQQPNKPSVQSQRSGCTVQAISDTAKGGTKSQGGKGEGGVAKAGPKGSSTDAPTASSKRDVMKKTGASASKDRNPTSPTQSLPPSGQREPTPPTQSLPPSGQRTKECTDASKSSNQKKQVAQRTTPGVKKSVSVDNASSHPPVSKTTSDSSGPRRTSVTPRRPAPGIPPPMQRSQTVTGKPPTGHENSRKKNSSTAAVRNTPSTR